MFASNRKPRGRPRTDDHVEPTQRPDETAAIPERLMPGQATLDSIATGVYTVELYMRMSVAQNGKYHHREDEVE
jgi:hypothetical protein